MTGVKGTLTTVQVAHIIPIYPETSSKALKKRLMRSLQSGEHIMHHLTLEKDPTEEVYYLLAGYPAYEVYKELEIRTITCIVQPYSDKTHQKIKVLQNMFHNNRGDWSDKCNIITDLLGQKDVTTKKIAARIGVKEEDLEQYLIHPEIPLHIADTARELKRIPIVEKVRKLSISDLLKSRLYRKAILLRNDPERLKHHQVDKIKEVLDNIPLFYELKNTGSEWRYVLDAINHRSLFLEVLQERIEEELYGSNGDWGINNNQDSFPPNLPN